MGAYCSCCHCFSSDTHDSAIKTFMRDQEQFERKITKVLFLGPGGSGKSTIFKQLQYIHDGGFSDAGAMEFKEQICFHIIEQMQCAVNNYLNLPKQDDENNDTNQATNTNVGTPSSEAYDEAIEANNPSLEMPKMNAQDQSSSVVIDPQMLKAIDIVRSRTKVFTLDKDIADAIQYIWKNNADIQNVFKKMDTKHKMLDETTPYFWDSIERITDIDYIPNETDILNVRARTTGIVEKPIKMKDSMMKIVDVGGQQNERKKWLQCFVDVKAVIFVTSLAFYNETMYEESSTNCMFDALKTFDEICNNKSFITTHMILFLNKTDLFQQKIVNIPVTECEVFDDFDDYCHEMEWIHPNPNDYDQTTQYIRMRFLKLNRNLERKVYPHFTCALHRNGIGLVFDDVQKIIFGANLKSIGYM